MMHRQKYSLILHFKVKHKQNIVCDICQVLHSIVRNCVVEGFNVIDFNFEMIYILYIFIFLVQQVKMSESECIFSKLTWLCKGGSKLVTAHKTRIINIISCSRQRKDLLHIELEESLENNKDFSVKCHSSCVSSYTSRFHLKRAVSSSDQFPGEVEPSSSKRLCRSSLSSFEFKKTMFVLWK